MPPLMQLTKQQEFTTFINMILAVCFLIWDLFGIKSAGVHGLVFFQVNANATENTTHLTWNESIRTRRMSAVRSGDESKRTAHVRVAIAIKRRLIPVYFPTNVESKWPHLSHTY